MKNLIVNDRGVYEQETFKLTPFGVNKRRRTLQARIIRLRRQIQDKELEIQRLKGEITQEEKNLETLSSPLVEAYLAREKATQDEIQQKAQALLKDCIGEDFYAKLQERKSIVFIAKDGIKYKIDAKSRVYRRVEKEWKLLCIIRPQNLPLPDFLLALFVNIRENPAKYPLRRR